MLSIRRRSIALLTTWIAPLVGAPLFGQAPALTIYNQDFAVVRESVPLELSPGENRVSYAGATLQLEADSVVLRDPTGKVALRILEQSYRADTLSAGYLLSVHEGKELNFLVRDEGGKDHLVRGKVIRSGYPASGRAGDSPIVEVDGQLRFSLPGEPLFPALNSDSVLKPTLVWTLATDQASRLSAEVSYLTGGLGWEAAYNLVASEKGDTLDVIGWVTLSNTSGKTFENAAIKLMAGNVNKIVQPQAYEVQAAMARKAAMADQAQVTEKAFDEFHLYTLPRATTLRDRETKQVEFLRAIGVKATTFYVYDGAALEDFRGWNADMIRRNPDYGSRGNRKVSVMREFLNTSANQLGVPLPAGRTRFYREDSADRRLEFTGENEIEHTAAGETVRIYTGDAFDLVGERVRTDYRTNDRQDTMEEAFEITLRNRKKEPAEIRVVEKLYRGNNADVVERSDAFTKTDAQTIEFRVKLAPDEERKVTYRVRYSWP